MNRLVPRLLTACGAIALLGHCTSSKDTKKKDPAEMSLAQRAMAKPDETRRSQFEKYIGGKGLQTGAGAWYQKQMHHAKGFNGADSYAGQKQFKTGESWFGKSKAKGGDMTYSMGDKQASMGSSSFKARESRFGSQTAREADSAFAGGDNVFKTKSALTRAKATPEAPLIIENIEATSAKNSAYSEDEVKKLLGR